MKKNIGKIDKMVRYVLAAIVAAIAYFANLWWLLVLSVILVVTALIGFCPIYGPLNISTLEKK